MLKFFSGAVIAICSTGAALAQDTMTWDDNVQGWTVVIDRTIENSCFIISGFEDELLLRFQFNATQQNVQFIAANINWKSLQAGKNYDMEVAFGDRDSWAGTAKAHRWNDILPSLVMSVPVENQQASDFMKEFTAMGSVRILHEGSEIANVDLPGASEAVAAMLDCQAAMANVKAPDADPFAKEKDKI